MSYVHGLNIYKITFMNNGHTHEGHDIVTSSADVTCLWIESSLLPLYLILSNAFPGCEQLLGSDKLQETDHLF